MAFACLVLSSRNPNGTPLTAYGTDVPRGVRGGGGGGG